MSEAKGIQRETITALGCYLDNHRGHYITRDVVHLAQEYGYIVGPFEQFALEQYEDHSHEDTYPYEALTELAEAIPGDLNADFYIFTFVPKRFFR